MLGSNSIFPIDICITNVGGQIQYFLLIYVLQMLGSNSIFPIDICITNVGVKLHIFISK